MTRRPQKWQKMELLSVQASSKQARVDSLEPVLRSEQRALNRRMYRKEPVVVTVMKLSPLKKPF